MANLNGGVDFARLNGITQKVLAYRPGSNGASAHRLIQGDTRGERLPPQPLRRPRRRIGALDDPGPGG